MRVLDNIERARGLSPEVFWREYVLPRKPVIVTDLFDGQPVRAIDTLEKALSALGDMRIVVREEYTTPFFRGEGFAGGAPRTTTLREYVAHVAANPATHDVVVQHDSEDKLRALYRVPDICRPPLGREYTFMANPGNYAHLHFDWEPTQNLLCEVFGRKRVMVIPSEAAHKLNPVMHIGTVMLERFSEDDKLAFLRYAGGYDAILGPGEAIYIPMMAWHHVEYVDLSLSFTTRFAENASVLAITERFGAHRNMYFQNIVAKLTLGDPERDISAEVGAILDAAIAPAETPFELYKRVGAVLKQTHDALCPESVSYAPYNYFPMELMQDQIIKSHVG